WAWTHLGRDFLQKPAVLAHELSHQALDLADAYAADDCPSDGTRPRTGPLFDCTVTPLTETHTSLMIAENCGSSKSVDYTELTTQATMPHNGQGAPCASESSVFPPGGSCDPNNLCP